MIAKKLFTGKIKKTQNEESHVKVRTEVKVYPCIKVHII